jgi:hypothetical protein
MSHEDVFTVNELGKVWDSTQRFLSFLDAEAGTSIAATTAERKAAEERRQFLETGVDLSTIVRLRFLKRDKDLAYYHLPVPLSVFPPPGTAIQSVEVELQFNPGRQAKPFVHDIFPRQEWQDVIKLEGGLKIGIDTTMKFAWLLLSGTAGVAAPFVESLLEIMPAKDLTIDPHYTFLLRKPLLLTSSEGADIALWRFSGRTHFEQKEHLQFGVILGVPLDLKQVRVYKSVRARRRNKALATRLAHDLERLRTMKKVLQQVFVEHDIDSVIEQLKRALRTEWNVVQEDLPLWNLDMDLRH